MGSLQTPSNLEVLSGDKLVPHRCAVTGLFASDEGYSMERDSGTVNFFFCIPLMPKANASDWGQVSKVFNQTLRSLDNQTNKSFQILLAAQDKPELAPDLSLDIIHLEASWTVGSDQKAKLRDKRWKRNLLLRTVRERGGGYVMMLDADDLVSNRLVDYVLTDRHPNGYIVESGYAYDWKANLIAPIPGVWGKGFDNVCGSCSIINFAPDDLPSSQGGDETADYLAKHLKQHSQWKHVMREAGRPLKSLPFPAAVYVLNHDNNLHYSLALSRQDAVPRKIKRRQVALSPALIKEFSLPSLAAPPAVSTVSPAENPRMKNRLFYDCTKRLPNFAMTVAFDVGANTGQTTEGILGHYPDARIYAFEPVSATFAVFNERVRGHRNVIPNRLALGSQCTTGTVTATGTSVRNSLTTRAGTAQAPIESVELLTGDVYCERHQIEHITYLKVDTEGSDLEVVKGFHRMIGAQRIDLIQVEAGMNPLNRHHVDFAAFRGYLEACNYCLFGIYDQVRETRGRPMLRKCSPVFISRRVIEATARGNDGLSKMS
jgi:FkbM family methyltransferase